MTLGRLGSSRSRLHIVSNSAFVAAFIGFTRVASVSSAMASELSAPWPRGEAHLYLVRLVLVGMVQGYRY